MTEPSPLARPNPWNCVAAGYVADTAPLLAHYARDALELAQPGPGERVLDVAAGPGTLSLLAAERVEHVTAIDFSGDMLDILRRRASEAGLSNMDTQVANGQSLPFADATFDAAFSMFGLMFFPDRDAGFCELRRVLRPGGRAVVSSWTPLDQVPLFAAQFEILRELLSELPFGDEEQPLANAETFRAEMTAAGFEAVEIHTATHRLERSSVRDFWQSQERSSAPIRVLRESRTAGEWDELSREVPARLEERFGTGPVHVDWPANLGIGRR